LFHLLVFKRNAGVQEGQRTQRRDAADKAHLLVFGPRAVLALGALEISHAAVDGRAHLLSRDLAAVFGRHWPRDQHNRHDRNPTEGRASLHENGILCR
jgi:hypothetical protein